VISWGKYKPGDEVVLKREGANHYGRFPPGTKMKVMRYLGDIGSFRYVAGYDLVDSEGNGLNGVSEHSLK
jgi:hypothetical protein